jgi:hypothetical protein
MQKVFQGMASPYASKESYQTMLEVPLRSSWYVLQNKIHHAFTVTNFQFHSCYPTAHQPAVSYKLLAGSNM